MFRRTGKRPAQRACSLLLMGADNKRKQISAGNTTTGRSRSVPEIQRQAEAGERQKYNNRQKQVSARNTTTGRSRSRQQYDNHQEQVCCADRLPSGAHHRHSCTWPIQQHTGICQYTTSYHSAEQRRARKGGARGGKAGQCHLVRT